MPYSGGKRELTVQHTVQINTVNSHQNMAVNGIIQLYGSSRKTGYHDESEDDDSIREIVRMKIDG